MTCDITVAIEAPFMPKFNANMNIGVSIRFNPTVSKVDSNDFLGNPLPRSKLLRLKNKNVIGLARSNISIYSFA